MYLLGLFGTRALWGSWPVTLNADQAPVPLMVFISVWVTIGFGVLWFGVCSADHGTVLHTSRPLHCRGVWDFVVISGVSDIYLRACSQVIPQPLITKTINIVTAPQGCTSNASLIKWAPYDALTRNYSSLHSVLVTLGPWHKNWLSYALITLALFLELLEGTSAQCSVNRTQEIGINLLQHNDAIWWHACDWSVT